MAQREPQDSLLPHVGQCTNALLARVKALNDCKDTEWKADPGLAKLAIDGEIDAIVLGDSDFSVCVGLSGTEFAGVLLKKDF